MFHNRHRGPCSSTPTPDIFPHGIAPQNSLKPPQKQGAFYGLSNTQTLYRFHMDDGTKEKIAPLSQSIQAMGLGLHR